MSKQPNPRQDPLTKIILMAYARGKLILAEREKQQPIQSVSTPKGTEPKSKNQPPTMQMTA